MKISHKISALVFFLVFSLGLCTAVALQQMTRISTELDNVVNHDMVLNGITNDIVELQLKKMIRFERILNVAEEIAFGDIVPARKKYLVDYLRHTKKNFDDLARQGAALILDAHEHIRRELGAGLSPSRQAEMRRVLDLAGKIEKAHIGYDQLVNEMYDLIRQGGFELSIADLDRVYNRERQISKELDRTAQEIQELIRSSLKRAEQVAAAARITLWVWAGLISLASLGVALLIIRSVGQPLKELVRAAGLIGEGRLDCCVEHTSPDEIGDVGRAFNTMQAKLAQAGARLEQKSQELAYNLRLTEQQKSDLERVNAEMDRFVYTVSHDIRSPLTGIVGYGSYLEKHALDRLEPKERDCVQKIKLSAHRLNQLIDDLLALTRITRIRNPYEEVQVNSTVCSVLERLEYRIKEAKTRFDIQKPLPAVVCDRVKLTEVFYNLISNAVKFSARAGREPLVRVGYRHIEGFHEFFVSDNGIGIDPENQMEVFGIFRRLHDASEYDGTGAGLSIVKSVIEDMGGRIWIESKVNEGAAFFFVIPDDLKVRDVA